MLPDVDMNKLPPQYPSSPSCHHYLDNFDFSLLPPSNPDSDRLESQDYQKLFNGGLNHDDDNDNEIDDDILGLEGMMDTYMNLNALDPNLMLDNDEDPSSRFSEIFEMG